MERTVKYLFALAATATLVLAIHSPCAQAQSEQARMPPNYRTLIANYMLSRGYPKEMLDSAKISAPFSKWGGLLRGGTIPTVCVAVMAHSLVDPTPRYWNIFFSVEEGQVHKLAPGLDQCPPFSPFSEVRNRKSVKPRN
jgi:hypothetical protein